MSRIKFISILAGLFCLWTEAQALTVLSLNLKQMSVLADAIFVGEVTGVEESWDAAARPIVTVDLDVLETLKGPVLTHYRFTQLRGVSPQELGANQITLVSQMPRFAKGEKLLLFMSAPSEIGLTAPIGLFQGRFDVKTDPATGEKIVVNAYGNKNLFLKMGSSQARLKLLTLKNKSILSEASPGAIEYDDFLSLVKGMVP